MRELALLNVARGSAFAPWLTGARLLIDTGADKYDWSPNGVLAWDGQPVDAILGCTGADLDRMLSRQETEGEVTLVVGQREAPARLKQARAVLAATALGWMGPMPNPNAPDDLESEVRRACLEIVVGPADRVVPLFSAAAPAEWQDLRVRVTERARRRFVTVGLSDTPLAAEILVEGELTQLRQAAAAFVTAGRFSSTIQLESGTFCIAVQRLASARGPRHLVQLRPASPTA